MFDQGVEIDILNDAVIGRAVAFFIEPFGLSHIDPIGGLIGGAFEATLIDEGFEQVEGMAKIGGPVLPEAFDIEGEELRSEVRDFNIGEN
jgi:hypothetical protein